jgi:hypothetical protein
MASNAVASGASGVRIYTENDGLESELLRDVAQGDWPGEVLVATDRGVGRFIGNRWSFPKRGPLAWRARSLARARDGMLWVATDHGVLAVLPDGRAERTYDVHCGMLEDELTSVVVDPVGRVWALGPSGISLIER